MGKETKWTKLEKAQREKAAGSGKGAPLWLYLAPGSGARLRAYLSEPYSELPDPADALGEPLQLNPREAWLRGVLDACVDGPERKGGRHGANPL